MELIDDYFMMMNDYFIRIEDSKLYDAGGNKGYYSLFTKGALLKMRDAIDNTIKAYDSLGWNDKDVYNRNYELGEMFRQRANESIRIAEPKKTRNTQDYLYLIHDTVQNTLKIGITANPKNRFRNIQLATSNKLVMLYALKGKAYLEKELHKEFADIRLASEWFKYDERIIERYKNL
jgi:hypothetical protein